MQLDQIGDLLKDLLRLGLGVLRLFLILASPILGLVLAYEITKSLWR